MRRLSLKGRVLTLKIRLEDFQTFTRRRTFSEFTNDAKVMREHALELFRKFDCQGKRVRLIGIGMSHLNNVGGEQIELFPTTEQLHREKIASLIDAVRDKFGEAAATRASLLGAESKKFWDDEKEIRRQAQLKPKAGQ